MKHLRSHVRVIESARIQFAGWLQSLILSRFVEKYESVKGFKQILSFWSPLETDAKSFPPPYIVPEVKLKRTHFLPQVLLTPTI